MRWESQWLQRGPNHRPIRIPGSLLYIGYLGSTGRDISRVAPVRRIRAGDMAKNHPPDKLRMLVLTIVINLSFKHVQPSHLLGRHLWDQEAFSERSPIGLCSHAMTVLPQSHARRTERRTVREPRSGSYGTCT